MREIYGKCNKESLKDVHLPFKISRNPSSVVFVRDIWLMVSFFLKKQDFDNEFLFLWLIFVWFSDCKWARFWLVALFSPRFRTGRNDFWNGRDFASPYLIKGTWRIFGILSVYKFKFTLKLLFTTILKFSCYLFSLPSIFGLFPFI